MMLGRRVDGFVQLAEKYTRDGRHQDALRLCREGLRQHPTNARLHRLLGVALIGLGDLSAALQCVRRAVELDPTAPDGHRLLSELARRTGMAGSQEGAASVGAGAGRGAAAQGRWSEDDTTAPGKTPTLFDDDATVVQAPYDRSKWMELGERWEETLDAGRNTSTEPEAVVGTDSLYGRQTAEVNVELPPLSHPLAEGMPPLPDDALPTHQAMAPALTGYGTDPREPAVLDEPRGALAGDPRAVAGRNLWPDPGENSTQHDISAPRLVDDVADVTPVVPTPAMPRNLGRELDPSNSGSFNDFIDEELAEGVPTLDERPGALSVQPTTAPRGRRRWWWFAVVTAVGATVALILLWMRR